MYKLEYVMSGPGYLRLEKKTLEKYSYRLKEIISSTVQGKNDHNFSLLFNALQEVQLGKNIKNCIEDALFKIHSDSGGLQAITRGIKTDAVFKKRVYQIQAENSHVGMCFDEIPLELSETSSSRNDTATRFFNAEVMKERAQQTGENITNQILYFLDSKSNCKPYCILHGNDYNSFYSWYNILMDTIPSHLHPFIGGFAVSGAAHGQGLRENTQRAFWSREILKKSPVKKLHLLGVGSRAKLIPWLIACKDLYEISYDSTTHSSLYDMGGFYSESGLIKTGVDYNQNYELVYQELMSRCSGLSISSAQELYKIMSMSYTENVTNGTDPLTVLESRWAVILIGISNFTSDVAKLGIPLHFLNYTNKKKLRPFLTLQNIKELEEFNLWDQEIGKYLSTDQVRNFRPNTLGDLFD